MSPQPAITVSGGRDKGGCGIAVMINDYLAFSTDIDLVERTLAGKSWDRGDKMGGGRRPRSSLAARGTIHCVGGSVNEQLALKTYSASSSAYVRVGSRTEVSDGCENVAFRGDTVAKLRPQKNRVTLIRRRTLLGKNESLNPCFRFYYCVSTPAK